MSYQSANDRIFLGGLFWLLTGQFFLAQFIAQSAWSGYDLMRFDISLLGITTCGIHAEATSGFTGPVCSSLHAVFNAGIVLHGALTLLGIWFTRPFWPREGRANAGLGLLALGGLGAILVGFQPLDASVALHVVGAILALGAPGFGFLLLGLALRGRNRILAPLTLATGIIVLVGGAGHALGGWPLERGIMERLAAWPQTLWYMGTGLTLLSASAPRPTLEKAPLRRSVAEAR